MVAARPARVRLLAKPMSTACALRPATARPVLAAAVTSPRPVLAFDIFALFSARRRERKLEKKFNQIAEEVKAAATGIPFPMRAQLYGLYKQALFGNVEGKGPSWFGSRAKFLAWKGNADMSKTDAMKKYYDLAQEELKKVNA